MAPAPAQASFTQQRHTLFILKSAGPIQKGAEKCPTGTEVPDWPFSGLALLVIEASLRPDPDPAAADENNDMPVQDGQ